MSRKTSVKTLTTHKETGHDGDIVSVKLDLGNGDSELIVLVKHRNEDDSVEVRIWDEVLRKEVSHVIPIHVPNWI